MNQQHIIATIDVKGIPSGTYMRNVAMHLLSKYWIVVILPLATLCLLSIINIDFLYLAIVLIFGAITLLTPLLYFYFGFSPESRYSILLEEICLTRDELLMQFSTEKLLSKAIQRIAIEQIIVKKDICIFYLRNPRNSLICCQLISPTDAQILLNWLTAVD